MLCGLLGDVGTVVRCRRPTDGKQAFTYGRVAQLSGQEPAAGDGAGESPPHPLWSAVRAIHHLTR